MPDTGLSLQTMRLLHFALGKEKCTVKKGTIRKQAGIRARQKERGKKCAVKQWLWNVYRIPGAGERHTGEIHGALFGVPPEGCDICGSRMENNQAGNKTGWGIQKAPDGLPGTFAVISL